jgi:large subunit ribosomal protein L4
MMATHFDQTGAESGTTELSLDTFGIEPREAVIHQAVVAHLANRRQGTASAKGRSDVHGTNKKPFRQKKTGQARQGDRKTVLQRGGGVYGGPIPRSYRQRMPKKQRRLALHSSLSIRADENAISVVEDVAVESGKTRDMVTLLRNMGLEGKRILFVTNNATDTLIRAGRNIPKLRMVPSNSLHTYDVMWAQNLVFTESALKALTGGADE